MSKIKTESNFKLPFYGTAEGDFDKEKHIWVTVFVDNIHSEPQKYFINKTDAALTFEVFRHIAEQMRLQHKTREAVLTVLTKRFTEVYPKRYWEFLYEEVGKYLDGCSTDDCIQNLVIAMIKGHVVTALNKTSVN